MSIFSYHLLKGVGFSDQRILQVLPRLQRQDYEEGDIILAKGAEVPSLLYLCSGLVGAGLPRAGQPCQPLKIFGQGTWFAETALLNGGYSVWECAALTSSRVLAIPMEDAANAFAQDLEFSRFVARLTSWRNRQNQEQSALHQQGNPPLRVVLGLALLAEDLHSSASHLPTSDLGVDLDIPLNQSLLASLCGVSRGIFSDCVQQLAQAGWLTPKYATLTLRHVATWTSISSRFRTTRYLDSKPSMQDLLAQFEPTQSASPTAQRA